MRPCASCFLRLFVTAALLLVLPGTGVCDATRPQIDDPAPKLGLPDLSGQAVELPAGKVVVVDFFATWCGPCMLAMAALDRIVRAEEGRVVLIVVDVGEPREQVAAFFARRTLPAGSFVVLDHGGEAARRFGQARFPTTFLVDGEGRIRHINRGYGSGYERRIGRWLRGMLHPERPQEG